MNHFNKQTVKEIASFIFWAGLFIISFRTFIAKPFIVSGESMVPTFDNGQYLFVDILSYWLRTPARGEVVVLRPPLNSSAYFIKRVIGLPGETVTFNDGQIIIKSGSTTKVVDEIYLGQEARTAPGRSTTTLGENEYFVMGDNRRNSTDSRVFGPVTRQEIKGRAFVRLLPLSKITYLPGSVKSLSAN